MMSALLLCLALPAAAQEQVPEWAQQGKFRFARLDGGPIEILKTARSSWGMHFNARQKEVLGNLYSTYSDRMVDLLAQANVNWVWITWSVGYSWQDEAVQREQCRLLAAKLHKKGIHVAVYLCAVSMFWESMFRDEPRSVRWVTFDPQGVPYRYSGGRDPLRFIADLSNPEWLDYQKRRIGAAIDAGADAFFLDNTASPEWSDNESTDRSIAQLRRFIREEKKSDALLLTNYGLASDRIILSHNMEVAFNEYWMEPGVWGDEWDASNVRRMRYVRGVVPEWKPLISEYSRFHTGTRSTGWLKPKSIQLGIAEAAAFRSAYAWDMEGPFDAALMDADPAALESWKAIGQYNGFLKDHEDLYWNARGIGPIAVLISEKPRRGEPVGFGWDQDDTGIYDLLAKNSVLFDIRLLSVLDQSQLASYAGVVLPASVALTARDTDMLRRYKDNGGKIFVLGDGKERASLGTIVSDDAVFETLRASEESRREILERVRGLAPGRLLLTVKGAPHVLGNITRLGSGKRLAIHLLNYDPAPVSGVRVRVDLDREFGSLGSVQPRLVTPDSRTAGITAVRRNGSAIEFTLQSLDTYGVAILE
jgi:hypothetical protein